MNTFFIDAARQHRVIPLGIQGENEATAIQFGVAAFLEEWPGATVSLTVKPPAGDTYPAVVTTENDVTTWIVRSSDTAHFGQGECELKITLGSVIKKSVTFPTMVYKSLKVTGEAPSPVETWIAAAEEALGNVQTATEAAEAAAESAILAASKADSAATLIDRLGLRVVDGVLCQAYMGGTT